MGILVELTFKVFHGQQAYATLKADLPNLDTALSTITRLFTSPLELDALDLTPPGTLWLRQGGIEGTLRPGWNNSVNLSAVGTSSPVTKMRPSGTRPAETGLGSGADNAGESASHPQTHSLPTNRPCTV